MDEVKRSLGQIDEGERDGVQCLQGTLKEGEALSGPVIRQLRHCEKEHTSFVEQVIVADCPPGSSCSVIHSAEGSDLALLVTEPTLFGLHDLKIAIRLMREMGLDFGVIQNKDDGGPLIREYCTQDGITLLGSIPFDLEIAKIYSRGQCLIHEPQWADLFKKLGERIVTEVNQRKNGGDNMKQMAIISGKGGTGKTTVAAAFAELAEQMIVADCDVEAPNLHLVLEHRVKTQTEYAGNQTARIDTALCTQCKLCKEVCRFEAVTEKGIFPYIDSKRCEGCYALSLLNVDMGLPWGIL